MQHPLAPTGFLRLNLAVLRPLGFAFVGNALETPARSSSTAAGFLLFGELVPAALLRLGPLEAPLVAAPSWFALEQRCLRHALTLALL